MYNAPYQGVANQLSQYGRFGDSTLVHMNPIEVQMLSRLSPTGQLTRNPVTGQPEAFLPFLAPLLGSFLGKAALGSALGAPLAGALGSAAAVTAATGDLEQGIMSGITGFGIGSALGGLGSAGADVAKEAATQAATSVPELSSALQSVPQDLGSMANAPMQAFLPENLMSNLPDTALEQMNFNVPQMPVDALSSGMQAGPQAMGQMGGASMQQFANLAPPPPSFTESLMQPFQQPGQFLSELAKPSSFLPMYVGESGRMAKQMEQEGRGSMRAYEEEQEAQRQKTLSQMGDVFNRVRSAYPGVGYAQGGRVERYFDGGYFESEAERAARNALYGASIPAAQDVQLSLRGQYALTPPTASYSALDVGGEGYMPGIAPEFRYFTDVNPNAPPPTEPATGASAPYDPTIPGGTSGLQYGGFDLGQFLGQFGGYRDYFGGNTGGIPSDPGYQTPQHQAPIGGFDAAALEEILSKQFNPLTERLNQIETDFKGSSGRNQPDLSSFENRFSNIEELLAGINQPTQGPIDFGPLDQRFIELENRFSQNAPPPIDLSSLETRLGGLENQLGNLNIAPPQIDLSGLEGRFSGLEERLGNLNVTQPPVDLSGLEQRLGGLEQGLGSLRSNIPSAPDLSGIYDRFGELETRLSNLPQPTAPAIDLSPIEQRLASIEGRGAPSFDPILERLSALEALLSSQQRGMGGLSGDSMTLGEFGGFAEGGMTSSPEPMNIPADPQQLLSLTVAAIRGEIEGADQVIRAFVEQFGPEAFMQLREQVLQDIVPGAQTEGMVEGMGGGQDDLVNGMIGSQRPVAVSPGEYIIPADVVSLAGGGYSGDGANFFDSLVDDIRQKTMGTTEQVRPYRRSA